jgi:hypothetical protein
MLIVINSMPKSGSSLLRHFAIEMIKKVNYNGQELLFNKIRNGEIIGRGRYIPRIDKKLLNILLKLSRENGPILIKVHVDYSEEFEQMFDNDEIVMTYNYRDPRDMILSAVDHHHRAKGMGQNEFSQFGSIEKSIPMAVHWAKQAVKWKQSRITYDISYKYFLQNKIEILNKINEMLGFGLSNETILSMIEQEIHERTPGKNQFNKGTSTRYENEMGQSELYMCNEALKEFIDELA